jgi:hypothetical protein
MLITLRIGLAVSHVQPRTWCIAFEAIIVAKQDAAPLFFGSPNWQNSRIPAGVERSFADNFLQKQQKQWGPFQRDALGKACRSDSQLAKEDQGEGIP